MNPYDDHYIVDMEIVAKVYVGFSVPSGTSPEAVEERAGNIVVTMSAKELIDNIYDIESVSFIGVEPD
jgi:hypothetical protein